ncbi:MAG TPA: hypothetical protein VMH23_05950 [Bacteroidota bacterium]|nr:hypothetical protein [Bacteroidota bacterium]
MKKSAEIHTGRRCTLWLLLTGLLLLPAMLSAQGIQVTAISAPVTTLGIGDVDFVNSPTPKWLFTIDINTGGRSITAVMRISLSVRLASGERYENPPAVELLTKAFAVNSTRTITNLDIGKGKAIGDSSYTKDPAAKKKFEEVALPSGTMPAGTYTFHVEVSEVSATPANPGTTDFTISLYNPTSMELLFPSDGDDEVGPLPLFQWMFDGLRSHIAIFEKLPSQSTLEEATTGDTVLSKLVDQTVFQYPSNGVRSLQPGKTYVWFVEGFVRSAGGVDQRIMSPLRSFKVEARPGAMSSLLDELEQALDPKYKPVFDQIRSEGLSPFGATLVNGAAVSGPDLQKLLDFIRNNPGAVLTVSVE